MDRARRPTTATGRTPGKWTSRAILVAVLAVSLVSGCSAGQQAQTSQIVPAIPGVDANAGPIALRDLDVPYRAGGYPAGSDVPLVVRMVSNAAAPVTVTRVEPGPGGVLLAPAQRISLRTSAASTTPAREPLVISPGNELALVPGEGPYLVADHVTTPMPYGAAVPVRFTFSTGDSVEVSVPMAPPAYPVVGSSPAPPRISAAPPVAG